jgi:hypothetical protein
MPSLGSLAENVAANLLAAHVTPSTVLMFVFLCSLAAWMAIRRWRSMKLRKELEALLTEKNHAINGMLNVLAGTAWDLAHITQDFNGWDAEVLERLHRLRREGLCVAWEVDHFRVLGTFALVQVQDADDVRLRGIIAEKAQRVKDIAARMEARAEALWPF